MIYVQHVIDQAARLLQDPTNIRWPKEEMTGYFEDGMREIVFRKPDSYVKNTSYLLDSGTKQILPDDGFRLMSVTRNMGTDSSTQGRSIELIRKDVLDSTVPDWHSQSQTTEVQHYVYDERNPKVFYVFPPNDGSNYIEMIYSAHPPTDVSYDSSVDVPLWFYTPVMNYIVYRCYRKDADYARNYNLALGIYQNFIANLQERTNAEFQMGPEYRQSLIKAPVSREQG